MRKRYVHALDLSPEFSDVPANRRSLTNTQPRQTLEHSPLKKQNPGRQRSTHAAARDTITFAFASILPCPEADSVQAP